MATPNENEINEVLNWCMDADEHGSNFPGMSYEQGAQAAIQWMSGDTDTRPDED